MELANSALSNADNLIDQMCHLHSSGLYSRVTVSRPWSEFNPELNGEFSKPHALRWYLKREFNSLISKGATIAVYPSRKRVEMSDVDLFAQLSEDDWDLRKKKLFLFNPERIDLSLNRLEHYTSTKAEDFQRYILFTNYRMHVEAFVSIFPNCVKPGHEGAQMPAYHNKEEDQAGITLVNIGVGPANAKTITDHIAVLRPELMIMVGHCGGLRNHQEIGDYVLASSYMRADKIMEEILPPTIPVIPNFLINQTLRLELDTAGIPYRSGTVYTTDNRNWEFNQRQTIASMKLSRSIAVDMESATIAANGYRYRIPHATLLCVSDKPLHGRPKLSNQAQAFYKNSKEMHLELSIRAVRKLSMQFPNGLPNEEVRSADEPLLGSHGQD